MTTPFPPKPVAIQELGPAKTPSSAHPDASFFAEGGRTLSASVPARTAIGSTQDPVEGDDSPVPPPIVANVPGSPGQAAQDDLSVANVSRPFDFLGQDPNGELPSGSDNLFKTRINLAQDSNTDIIITNIGDMVDHNSQGSAEQLTKGENGVGLSTNAAAKAAPTTPIMVTVADQAIDVSNPSGVSMFGSLRTSGGPAADKNSVRVSMARGGNLVIESHPPPSPTQPVLKFAGMIFTANPTSFNVDGTPIEAGKSGATISGLAMSLDTSGNLMVEGRESLVDGTRNKPPEQTILSAGGPGLTLKGMPVTMNAQGSLILESETLNVDHSNHVTITLAGQEFASQQDGQNAASGTMSSVNSNNTSLSTSVTVSTENKLSSDCRLSSMPSSTSSDTEITKSKKFIKVILFFFSIISLLILF